MVEMRRHILEAESAARRLNETEDPKGGSIRKTLYAYPIDPMPTVKISPKFQVVIPQQVREKLQLKAGQRVEVLLYDNRIELVPVKPMRELRGFLKGIDSNIEREPDRVL